MSLRTPIPVRLEHQELHDVLAKASHEPGEIGAAASLVARLMAPHARKEEQFAMPPLGLLADLAKGRVEPHMASAIGHAAWLRTHLGDMLAEHRAIVYALERLVEAAKQAKRYEYAELAERLITHARIEEEVLYPAAILVGEYLKLRLPGSEPA
jgi:hypothetical protein